MHLLQLIIYKSILFVCVCVREVNKMRRRRKKLKFSLSEKFVTFVVAECLQPCVYEIKNLKLVLIRNLSTSLFFVLL